MRGILYGVGVGPGDPELMTLKAVRLIKENDIIAVPGAEVKQLHIRSQYRQYLSLQTKNFCQSICQ